MRVICAPDSFKESLSAEAAALAMARGVLRACPDAIVDRCPIADGGEGTVAAMQAATTGQSITTTVTGPLGSPVEATWVRYEAADGQAAGVMEMASAAGLMLVPMAQRDPTRTSTFGVGELLRTAARQGIRRILLGIGGSATCDLGAGMAAALGVQFLDSQDKPIPHPAGGDLGRVRRILLPPPAQLLPGVKLTVACDVTNPLTGPKGAAYVYAPQKGASPQQVQQLDENLKHIARLLREQHGIDIEHMPGSGAAGGLGAGLVAFLGAELGRGAQLVLQAVGFSQRASRCDWCLTGEGSLDGQSLQGKAVMSVTAAASAVKVPTYAFVGRAGDGAELALKHGLAGYRVIAPGLSREESMARAAELLEQAVYQWASVQVRS